MSFIFIPRPRLEETPLDILIYKQFRNNHSTVQVAMNISNYIKIKNRIIGFVIISITRSFVCGSIVLLFCILYTRFGLLTFILLSFYFSNIIYVFTAIIATLKRS
jgi:hypothetical protein